MHAVATTFGVQIRHISGDTNDHRMKPVPAAAHSLQRKNKRLLCIKKFSHIHIQKWLPGMLQTIVVFSSLLSRFYLIVWHLMVSNSTVPSIMRGSPQSLD